MVSLSGSAFARRSDKNGAIVSTCNKCFAAVAVAPQETELERAERDHACNPEALDQWKLFIAEIKQGKRRRERVHSV